VPDALLKDTAAMRKYLAVSFEYVKTLESQADQEERA
jgi:hypothetical protein